MGAFTSALMAAGIAMNAYGQIKAGKDAYAAGQYNAAVYKQQSESIDVKKGISKQRWDRVIRQLGGKLTTAVASSGYDYSGSFLEVINDRLTEAQLDKQMELYNLELSKSQSMSAADEAMRAGASARTASLFGAAGTVLTEGNEWYSNYGRSSDTPTPKPTVTTTFK